MHDIAICTISWIRTEEEKELVLQTIHALNDLEVPLIIVDGGSSFENKERIKSFSNVAFFEANGLKNQLLLSHKEAAKRGEYLFYLHTDKREFAEQSAKNMIDAYRRLSRKGLLIPTRTPESIATYPAYQRQVEDFLNFFMCDYIGIAKDYYAGPKIYPASLVKYFDQLTVDIGWGIEAYLYVIAKRLNMPFDFLPAVSPAPKDIDCEEKTKNYRLKITEWQIQGFLKGQEVML